ncbi:MAG: YcbK family protein [Deltaproteobacteria bacterium]|nr:YcbK family protein [Deltaproteobacteria bacterium]
MLRFKLVTTFSTLILMTSISISAAAFEETTIPTELRGDGELTLFRPVKNERSTFKYRNREGDYDQKVFDDIAHFFRCRMTDEPHPIDPKLIEIIDAIEDHFAGREIKVISAYRSPTRNNAMRRKGRRVAKRSLHMDGMAADIEVKGTPKKLVRNFAYKLKQGGIGYYGRRTFVHVDTGPLRTWGWKPTSTTRSAAMANK